MDAPDPPPSGAPDPQPVARNLEPIKAFVGDEHLESAVVPAVVREMMVTFDPWVVHYEIAVAKPH